MNNSTKRKNETYKEKDTIQKKGRKNYQERVQQERDAERQIKDWKFDKERIS